MLRPLLFLRLHPLEACSVPKSDDHADVKVQEHFAQTPTRWAEIDLGLTPCETQEPPGKSQERTSVRVARRESASGIWLKIVTDKTGGILSVTQRRQSSAIGSAIVIDDPAGGFIQFGG
jgi:hypothetical protein